MLFRSGRRLPVLAAAAAAAVASMIGLPPLLGFVAKEAAVKAFAHGGLDAAVLAGVVAGSALTVAYGLRFLHGAFGGAADTARPGEPWGLVVPVVLLAASGFALGVYPAPVQSLVEPYAAAFGPGTGFELTLWHGFGLPIALSLVALVAGAAVYAAVGRTFPARAVRWRAPDAQRAYDGVVESVLAVAHAVTRREIGRAHV
mgnify:CR=1 FL=1